MSNKREAPFDPDKGDKWTPGVDETEVFLRGGYEEESPGERVLGEQVEYDVSNSRLLDNGQWFCDCVEEDPVRGILADRIERPVIHDPWEIICNGCLVRRADLTFPVGEQDDMNGLDESEDGEDEFWNRENHYE